MRKVIALFIVLLILTACSTEPCSLESQEYLRRVEDLYGKFQTVAIEMPRSDADFFDQLNGLRDEALSLDAPKCASDVEEHLGATMSAIIDTEEFALAGNTSAADEAERKHIVSHTALVNAIDAIRRGDND